MKLTEAYIKAEKGNIYYTKNSDIFLSIVKSIFISNNKAVRVYYDINKGLYVFGDAFNYIHADLANGMKYHSNIYGADEMRANVSYLKQNCALFQVLPDDNFKEYDVGDGYTKGRFLILDDLIFACREKEYKKVRDNVPLFKDHIGDWMDVQYYLSKKNNINESVENNTDEKLNSKTNCKIVLKDGKTIYGHLLSVNENYVYINSNNGNRIKKDNIKELYMYYDCEVILKDGRTIYGNFVGDFGDHKLHLDDAFNRKGWAIKDEMIEKVNYKKVIKHTFDTEKLKESVEDKILYIIRGVPGSGKSTLAHKLTDNVVEADQYFYDDKGNYNWSADKLNQAHNWCFYTVKKYMEEGRDKIAVANTFVKNRDYKRYVELAKEFGYKVDIRTCTGNYQNIHNVPDETVEKMRSKFQETPLDESIAFVSKKDLSDIILKNPTRKELKENGLEFCRYMFEDDNTYYFVDAKEYSHLDISQLFLDVFKNYNLHTDGGYYSVKENCFYIRNDFGCEKNKERLDNTKLLHKLFGNFKSVIYEGDYPEEWVDEQLDESAENDKTLRDYAVKLANIVLDAMVKTKYKSNLCTTQIQVFIDKEFKKAVPMLKNSPYEYVLLLTDKNDDPYPSYGKTPDRKYALITLPICNGNPCNGAIELLMKHKAMLNKIHRIYQGDELTQKIKETAIKYLKKEIEKKLKDYKGVFFEILVHECTHLIDDLRRTKSYKSKEQNQSTENGQIDYYNSPEEQNAFYQETVSAFDEWIKNEDWKKDWKNFNNFQNEFIKQYKGDYNRLNNINKRKLKKRAYAYWYVYMKD